MNVTNEKKKKKKGRGGGKGGLNFYKIYFINFLIKAELAPGTSFPPF